MLGWGGVVGGCDGRCMKQDLRDFLGIFGIRARSGGEVCWESICEQDLRDFLGIFGMGVAHGNKEKIGWKDWQDDKG